MHNLPLFLRTNSTCTLSEKPSHPSACQAHREGTTAGRKERREGRREGPELQTRWFTRQDPSIPMSFRVKRNELWSFHSLLLVTAKTKKEMKT